MEWSDAGAIFSAQRKETLQLFWPNLIITSTYSSHYSNQDLIFPLSKWAAGHDELSRFLFIPVKIVERS
jgi:hypothetical protein